jgi:hypothetical protein
MAFLMSLWGLSLRYQCLAERELWNDEIYEIQQTLGAFKPFWKKIQYGDFTFFPGEYWLTYPFVNLFPYSKWAMAVPHILSRNGRIVMFAMMFRWVRGTAFGSRSLPLVKRITTFSSGVLL